MEIPKDNFLWGAAISAHQTEGDNIHSDWWYFEQMGKIPKSGKACEHYKRFSEDFSLAREIGLNAMRVSIEWARIEPEEGVYDIAQIKHYSEVLIDLRIKGFRRFLTLHHFSLPLWAAKKGGFLNKSVVDSFVNFSGLVVKELGDEIDFLCTINEPEVHALLSYIRGVHPPFKKNPLVALRYLLKLVKVHNKVFTEVKRIKSDLPVGIVKNNVYYEPNQVSNFFDNFVCSVANFLGNDLLLYMVRKRSDFIGLNYYFTNTLRLSLKGIKVENKNVPKSDMGWRTYPPGLYFLLIKLKKFKLPIYITENGIADSEDNMRGRFITEHVESVMKAKKEGVDVRGYLYWSLLDNYEWHDGYGPRFGLIQVDYLTQERKMRESAKAYKQLIKSNG